MTLQRILRRSFTAACMIACVGTGLALAQQAPGRGSATPVAMLPIPDVDEMPRVDGKSRLPREAMRNSAFVMQTQKHAVNGDKYVILTDHTEPGFLKPLRRLAKHRDGVILRTDDLALLHKDEDEMAKLRKELQSAKVRYLAIAPRMETFRENMLLGMWELISTLDSDPQLDAYPGFLLASNEEKFAALIDRSIQYKPQSGEDFHPFALNQVPSTRELRSLQKSAILRKMFAKYGHETPILALYTAQAKEAPRLPGDQFWSVQMEGRGDFLKALPEPAAEAFDKASLLVMHGHGIPGMSCSVDIDAIPEELSPQVVLCGSCFSAAPRKSDLPAMRQAPGGYNVVARDAFALRMIDSGATVVFGHMRLNSGFPHLFPVLETWMEGRTVGEAYQELMNAIIEKQGTKSGQFVVPEDTTDPRRIPQNVLLYVIIGDPAIQPLAKMTAK